MDELHKILNMKIVELEQVIKQAEAFLSNAPEGTLRIKCNKNTQQYYLGGTSKGKYIKKKEIQLIRSLAQKDYAKKILGEAHKAKQSIQHFLGNYHPEKIQDIYGELPLPKRQLLNPYVLPDEEYAARWKEQEYQVQYAPEGESGIYTENGEAVRSKSEKILADKFKTMGIPYHYEKPLYLKGYGVVHPDFTVLNKRTRREYYWEHMGMMDCKEYCEKAVKKIETMSRNGIIQGKNLILTYETQTHPLNIKNVDILVREYLI